MSNNQSVNALTYIYILQYYANIKSRIMITKPKGNKTPFRAMCKLPQK